MASQGIQAGASVVTEGRNAQSAAAAKREKWARVGGLAPSQYVSKTALSALHRCGARCGRLFVVLQNANLVRGGAWLCGVRP